MYSHRPDHSRQYSERRHRDPDDEPWEKHEALRSCHRKYGGGMERTSRSREYSKDSASRERRPKSPLRRHVSSPDWEPSEQKRRRLPEDEEHHKYRHLAEVKTSRQLSLDSAYTHPSADFSHEEDCESQKRTRSSRQGHHHEELVHRKRYEDDHERTWGCPGRTRTQMQEDSGKNQKRDISHQKARPDENTSSKGFQRFLDVLNKGVNVATLAKILTSVKEDDRPLTSHLDTKAQPSSPPSAGREQQFGQTPNPRSEDVEFWRTASSENHRKSLSTPRESCGPDGPALQACDGDRSYSGSGSLTHLEKIALTPEEEHKHKQAQHVLQAIGMNLESEELGQMSHRIQERLYGKRDGDRGRLGQHSRKGDPIRGLSPKLHYRSSTSSRSTCSPSPEKSKNRDSFQPGEAEQQQQQQQQQIRVHHSTKYGSGETFQESPDSEAKPWDNLFPCQAYSQNLAYTLPEPRPPPMMPVYSPASDPRLPFPAPLPNLSQPGPLLCFPPVPPYPRPPPGSVFPAVLAQMRPLFPPPFGNPLVPPLTPPQKPKPFSRPRCLQVIETKQPS